MNKILSVSKYFVFGMCLFCVKLSIARQTTAMIDAGEQRNVAVYGMVEDMLTLKPVHNAQVTMLTPDSIVVDRSRVAGHDIEAGSHIFGYLFMLSKSGKYILRIDAKGYERKYVDVEIKLHRREIKHQLPKISIQRKQKAHTLDEVTVTASKVKFFHQGDTLVFNADAFNTQKGSMLDDLIRQLPGVRLSGNGVITVNGKKVGSLLLQGKNFFSKDRNVMLSNLPSYIVDQVKVYDKESDWSALAGRKIEKDSYVMDVVLKRDYQVGWLANADAGYGTKERYEEKLFAMRFSTNSRFSAFGNANNVGNHLSPTQSGTWQSPSNMRKTEESLKKGGLDYNFETVDNRFNIYGDVMLEGNKQENQSRNNTQLFISGGDLFTRTKDNATSSSTAFFTNHHLSLKNKRETNSTSLDANAYIQYSDGNSESTNTNGTFSVNPDEIATTDIVDSLENGNLSGDVVKYLINRNTNRGKTSSNNLTAKGSANFRLFKINGSDDYLHIGLNTSYSKSSSRSFNHYLYEYPATSADTDFRNRYDSSPNRNFSLTSTAVYNYYFNRKFNAFVGYEFRHTYSNNEQLYYRLDRLDTWGVDDIHPIGSLPSTADSMLIAMDSDNSYLSKRTTNIHTPYISFTLRPLGEQSASSMSIGANLRLNFKKERLNYNRFGCDTISTNKTTYVNPKLEIELSKNKGFKFKSNLEVEYDFKTPNMESLLNVVNNTNPLHITMGNPNLRNEKELSSIFTFQPTIKWFQFILLRLYHIRSWDGISQRTTFDRTTGVYTTMPVNVSGDRVFQTFLYMSKFFNLNKRTSLDLQARISNIYRKNVDLVTTSDESGNGRNMIKINNFNSSLEASLRKKNLELTFNGKIS